MSEDAKKRALRVIAAERRTRRKGKRREWRWERGRHDRVYIPQGSTLGDTLIQLSDTYDGSAEDCRYVESACAEAPALALDLLTALDAKTRLMKWIADKHYDLREVLDACGLDPREGGPCIEADE